MDRTMRRLACGVMVFLTLGSLPGCGGSGSKSSDSSSSSAPRRVSGSQVKIVAVLSQLQVASRRGDGRTICSRVFTPAYARTVASASKTKSCPREVRARLFPPTTELAVGQIKTNGATASAVVKQKGKQTRQAQFVRQGGTWRLSGLR